MIQRTDKIKNRKTVALILAIATLVVLLSLIVLIFYNYSVQLQEDREYELSLVYHQLISEIQNFTNQNISLLSGFAAYIQMNDVFSDEEIYTYLNYLLEDHLEDMRNIGVLRDTTIEWMYPLEGNEAAIGIDLSKVSGQSEAILKVKENLETLFVGPVDLVQGGVGFIIRMPLLKDEEYWGMVSIVLKAEQAFEFIEHYANEYQVDYLITYADQSQNVIYGNPEILNMSPLKFRTEDTLGGWDIYTIPKGGWKNYNLSWGIIVSIFTLIGVLISRSIYFWIINYNNMLTDKVELERKYLLDRFTGIYTREHFNMRVREEIKQVERHGYPISMIYFDLDHFKSVNDTYGHSTGDKVLLQVVDVVKTIIRTSDVFARWGGDEFIVLLPHTDLEEAKAVAERIRNGIKNLEINHSLGITSSVGCSQWVEREYAESWFVRTDKALYISKNTGKDKVTANDHETEKEILVRVDWDDSWISGNAVIDEEHINLLNRCNEIIETSLNKEFFNETLRSVEAFLKELEKHFDDEIEILHEVKYPSVESHGIIHRNLLDQSQEIYIKTMREEVTPVELFHFLLIIVMKGHIKNEDSKYRKYL